MATDHASRDGKPQLLGQYLVEMNAITRDQLHYGLQVAAIAAVSGFRTPIGETLVDLGFISNAQLELALARQARAMGPAHAPVSGRGGAAFHILNALHNEERDRGRGRIRPSAPSAPAPAPAAAQPPSATTPRGSRKAMGITITRGVQKE